MEEQEENNPETKSKDNQEEVKTKDKPNAETMLNMDVIVITLNNFSETSKS